MTRFLGNVAMMKSASNSPNWDRNRIGLRPNVSHNVPRSGSNKMDISDCKDETVPE